MPSRELEAALARCLEDLDTGRSTVAECLERYPEHAAVLRRLLDVHGRLAGAGAAMPVPSGERGRQQMLAALAVPVAGGTFRVIPGFLAAMPKAVSAALAALVITGGAVGASAAAGGPNLPAQAWSVVSSHVKNNDHDTKDPDATPTGTVTVNSTATETPGSGLDGRCNALTRGSEQGQANKRDNGKAFDGLVCPTPTASSASGAAPTATETPVNHGKGDELHGNNGKGPESTATPSAESSPTATPTAERGPNEHASPNAQAGGPNR